MAELILTLLNPALGSVRDGLDSIWEGLTNFNLGSDEAGERLANNPCTVSESVIRVLGGVGELLVTGELEWDHWLPRHAQVSAKLRKKNSGDTASSIPTHSHSW